ncbi:hypothetical protein GM182_02665 [bacterium 3DAC]|jgi:hypothetical protein|nr:hypothetical protein [Dictyoglomota bacterium]UZN22828.1 hypothetical protein GM182_02665 [bacterium 3DAC]
MGWIYGPVNNVEDIARINCIIRDEMMIAESPEVLTELKKRSDYLCTLTHSPFWKKKFGDKIDLLKEEAIKQNRATVRLANMIAKVRGWNKEYSPWGKDKYPDFEKHLQEVVDMLLEEIEKSVYEDKTQIEVDIRKLFCQIRFSMLYADSKEKLYALKKKAEVWVFTTFGKIFVMLFDVDALVKLRDMTVAEFNRTIDLANIVAEYNGWDIEFEYFNESDMEQEEDIEEYIERLEEEEKKASEYIPTEAKYGDAKVLWIVYELPKVRRGKKRRAKRVYLPADAEDIQFEGPDWFETRFGRRVWGIKITYTKTIGPRVIRRGDMEISIGPTKVKRSKIVSLPEGVTEYEVMDTRPADAMAIA